MRRLKNPFLLAAAALCLSQVIGCYASVGPTFGYKTGEGFTMGGEIDAAGLVFAHVNTGFFVSQAKTEDGSQVATFYGSLGPGFYLPAIHRSTEGFGALGVGMVADNRRDSELAVIGHLGGGPSFMIGGNDENYYVFNCILGMNFKHDAVWFYLSPQVGIGYNPVANIGSDPHRLRTASPSISHAHPEPGVGIRTGTYGAGSLVGANLATTKISIDTQTL